MKRQRRIERDEDVEEDFPIPVQAEEEEGVPSGRFLALHVCPDSKGNVQVGAASLDCLGGGLTYLARTIAWEGEVAFLFELILDLHCNDNDLSGLCILLSSKLGESFVDALNLTLEGGKYGATKLIVLPSAFFDFAAACKLIANRFAMSHALGAVLDLTNRASVSCVGAVFAHTQRLFPDRPPISFDVFDLGKFLVMDAGSMRALDVVKDEEHPSVIRGRGRAKEGFTLLSLLDHTKSTLGAKTLRRWVQRPLTHVGEIEARYDAVDFLRTRMGQEPLVRMSRFLAQIGDLPRSLLRLKTCTAKAKDWLTVSESLQNIVLCFQALKEQMSSSVPLLLQDILQASEQTGLFQVSRALDLLDWDAVKLDKSNGRVVPIQGASEAVDEARRRLQALPEFLSAETASANLAGFTIRCIPVIGFVAAVELDLCPLPNVEATPGFELLFEAARPAHLPSQTEQQQEVGEAASTESLIRYFKTDRTRFLDAELGDVIEICRDLEDAFLRQIEEIVLAHEADLLVATHRCAELDVLLCFAEVSHDFNYVRPELTARAETRVRGARHPLLERVLDDRFVPSDLELDGQVLVITGPNFSGKSVVLKTLALLSILAQIGCFIPAERARLGVVDRIFTRMSGLETVGSASHQRESSFSIDVQQVAGMLRGCTPNSLLCIDEYGKGTNTMDGAALLAAVIQHLASGKAGPTPRTAIATHLVEIFDAKLVDERVVMMAEMRVEFQQNGEPVPLFRLVSKSSAQEEMGVERDSYGIACAKRVGMCEQVVERAQVLANRIKHHQRLLEAGATTSGAGGNARMERAVKALLEFKNEAWTDADLDRFFNLLL